MKTIYIFFILSFFTNLKAQSEFVFVFFKDKPNKSQFYSDPTSELTQHSLDRRLKMNIPLADSDAPLEKSYITSLQQLGFEITAQSKWLNGVGLEINHSQLTQIQNLAFVDRVESFVKNQAAKSGNQKTKSKFDNSKASKNLSYGVTQSQLEQINVKVLHDLGFTGKNVRIAVIDVGFPTVDTGSTFAKIRSQNQIKETYNFISRSSDVYDPNLNAHGTACLGILAGSIENTIVGSAPDADYYLYVTEINNQEIPAEELYWIEAAEQADRSGIDVISSSLGYANGFDDPRYDYTYASMNGKTTFIARGAKIATDKGILVANAIGNEGNKPWHYLVSPSDVPQVFSVGGVDVSGNPSVFSSFGPNAEGVTKPDGNARGTATYLTIDNSYFAGNGTSFATPLVAGGFACLIQASPNQMNGELQDKIRKTASLYPSTTDQLGNGIVNFYAAYQSVLASQENPFKNDVKIAPNPVKSSFNIQTNSKILRVEIVDSSGRLVKSFSNQESYSLEGFSKGMYHVKIQTEKGTSIEKLIKE